MKKVLAILLIAAMALGMAFSMTACGGSGSSGEDAQADAAETRVFTDGLGREVTIPTNIERIVPLGNTPRMSVYLGLADKFVGIPECEIAKSPIMAFAYPYREVWDKLPKVGTDAMGETAYYAEEIIQTAPDVILCNYTKDVADNIQNQTGIPVIAVKEADLFSEEYDEALTIIGDACGVSERAEAVINYIDESIADLENRVKDIPEEGKPTVLGAGATFKGSHSIDGVYKEYSVFRILAANDVANGLTADAGTSGVMVDREQIIAWDPDMIFFDAGSMTLVRTDYAENPGYFNQLKAVKNGELYQWPNSTWHWSNVEIPLVSTYYVGALLYPEAFEDINFEEKASEIFDFFIGQPDYLKKTKISVAFSSKLISSKASS